nr:hypothetical protein [uncultured Niameybacter sp.]
MIEKRISKTIHDAMEQQHTSVSFDDVWEQMHPVQQKVDKGVKKVRGKKLITILVAATMLMGISVSAEYYRRKDDISYTFKMDKKVLGTWRSVGFVAEEKDFVPDNIQDPKELYLQELIFCKNGDILISVNTDRGAIKTTFGEAWTNGHIINRDAEINSAYKIKNIDGKNYMFYEWKSGDYVYKRIDKPYLYVLEYVEDEKILDKAPPLERVKQDDINIDFEDNEAMKGNWVSVDLVYEIEQFNPDKPQNSEEIWMLGMELQEKGKVITAIKGVEPGGNEGIYWSKDVIVNKWDQTVSKCTIKEIEGSTYMFYEWKSGDYIFDGAKPLYYVLKKQ